MSIRQSFRRYARSIYYKSRFDKVIGILRRHSKAVAPHRTAAYWDSQLSGGFRSYLGGTLSVDCRNEVTGVLIRHLVPSARVLLDIACASGSLGLIAKRIGIERYIGVDISTVAIEAADPSLGAFFVSDLCGYIPEQNMIFDVIVFNEVLYYIDVAEVPFQMRRYAEYLSPNGVLLISLKDDPKSHQILKVMSQEFEWVNGVIMQQKRDEWDYSVRTNAERPANLLGALRPRVERGI